MTKYVWTLAILAVAVGCTPKPAQPVARPAPAAANPTATNRAEIGKNVTLEVLPSGQRRVVVPAAVCLREGPLEMFLCRRHTKEHESVLTADIDARDLHTALLAAGAVAGSPVHYEPTYQAARGTPVRILVRFAGPDGEKTINAREWVRDVKTGKELATDWVFGGSFFFTAGDEKSGKRELYAANGGEVVCVSNFGGALMDLPVESPADNEELNFEAFTERIPELGTTVEVIFEPQPQAEKTKG